MTGTTFLELRRWRDGAVEHVRADAIVRLATLTPNHDDAPDRPTTATIVQIGEGHFTEWYRETPDEIMAAIRRDRLVALDGGTP